MHEEKTTATLVAVIVVETPVQAATEELLPLVLAPSWPHPDADFLEAAPPEPEPCAPAPPPEPVTTDAEVLAGDPAAATAESEGPAELPSAAPSAEAPAPDGVALTLVPALPDLTSVTTPTEPAEALALAQQAEWLALALTQQTEPPAASAQNELPAPAPPPEAPVQLAVAVALQAVAAALQAVTETPPQGVPAATTTPQLEAAATPEAEEAAWRSVATTSADPQARHPLPVVEPGGEMPVWVALEHARRGEVVSEVTIRNLLLRGTFEHPVVYKHVMLHNMVVEEATFKGEVGFYGCTLERGSFRGDSSFEQGLHFGGSTLRGCGISKVSVRGGLDFDNCKFTTSLRIEDSKLGGEQHALRMSGATFEDMMELSRCELAATADFRNMSSTYGMIFTACHFQGDVLFSGATIAKQVDFVDSRCEQLLDFSKSKLGDFVYLESIHQGEQQRFSFFNAVAERLMVSVGQLDGRLSSEQRGRWLKAAQEYGLLKRAFENLHRFDDEDWAFYRFKVNQRRAELAGEQSNALEEDDVHLSPGIFKRVKAAADWLFLDVGCGYGTDPWKAVRAALAVIFCFALIYAVGFDRFSSNEGTSGWLAKLAYSTVISVSVFTSGFTGDLIGETKGWLLLPLMCEALIGTLLFGLFIVAFSRKVIR